MPECASHYPISKLIARVMNETGRSRLDFVQALGYRNIERGLGWMKSPDTDASS